MKKVYTAINWNTPENKTHDDFFRNASQRFWLPEEIPVSLDLSTWMNLEPVYKDAYEKILAGLTLLDTEQTGGISKLGE